MSFGALTCFVGHPCIHHIKVSQVMNLIAPLRSARRDDRNGHIICYIWSPGQKDIKFANKRALLQMGPTPRQDPGVGRGPGGQHKGPKEAPMLVS